MKRKGLTIPTAGDHYLVTESMMHLIKAYHLWYLIHIYGHRKGFTMRTAGDHYLVTESMMQLMKANSIMVP